MKKKYSQISSNILATNPYWVYKKDRYTLPDFTEGDYHYIETTGSVIIIPLLSYDTIIMVKQFRYLNQKVSLEFPGGSNKISLSSENNAKRELAEEIGYYPNKLIKIGTFNPFIGVTNEFCNVYVGLELISKKLEADKSEEFEIVNLNINSIDDKIQECEIWSGMTLATWALFKNSIYYKRGY
ncbi:MAG TPA: NUDIX hydrolase [Candidatus Kapabacteria bacterium]|nr:NUDIX hydrolase [Candidatus Kapabacteria bacterium]